MLSHMNYKHVKSRFMFLLLIIYGIFLMSCAIEILQIQSPCMYQCLQGNCKQTAVSEHRSFYTDQTFVLLVTGQSACRCLTLQLSPSEDKRNEVALE